MKQIKQFYSILLLFLIVSAVGCTDEETAVNTGDSNVDVNEQYSSSAVDSLNSLLMTYEAEEKRLSDENAELHEKINNTPDEKVRVIYKTGSDKSLKTKLANEKIDNLEKDSEINKQKDIIAQNDRDLKILQDKINKLKGQNNPQEQIVQEDQSEPIKEIIEKFNIVIREGLSVSDIDTKLYTAKEDNKKIVKIIETSFTINENQLAKNGEKIAYICIYGSNKKILHHKDSETFIEIGGNTKFYTTKNEFVYNNEKLRFTVTWEKEEYVLIPGQYTIEFYIDNILSGAGLFDIN